MTNHPTGRRTRVNAARAALQTARNRGLVLRHRARLARIAQANPGTTHHCGYCHTDVPLVDAYEHQEACRARSAAHDRFSAGGTS